MLYIYVHILLYLSDTLFRKYIFIEMNTPLKLETTLSFYVIVGKQNCQISVGYLDWKPEHFFLRCSKESEWNECRWFILLSWLSPMTWWHPTHSDFLFSFMWLEWWGTLGRLSASLRKPVFYWKKLHGFPLLTHCALYSLTLLFKAQPIKVKFSTIQRYL